MGELEFLEHSMLETFPVTSQESVLLLACILKFSIGDFGSEMFISSSQERFPRGLKQPLAGNVPLPPSEPISLRRRFLCGHVTARAGRAHDPTLSLSVTENTIGRADPFCQLCT